MTGLMLAEVWRWADVVVVSVLVGLVIWLGRRYEHSPRMQAWNATAERVSMGVLAGVGSVIGFVLSVVVAATIGMACLKVAAWAWA